MRLNGSGFRQNVDQYRDRLDKLARGELDHQRRPKIITTGRSAPILHEQDTIKRLAIYGRRRQNSVARVMALFAVLRDHENLASGASGAPPLSNGALRNRRPVEVTHTGAKWQAFGGTHTNPACHSCPALLELNSLMPTYMTDNMGLRRHIIVVFSDCMMMPDWVNDADGIIDSAAGRQAFADAAYAVINHADATWQQGLTHFTEAMRDILGGAFDVLFGAGAGHVKMENEDDAMRLEAVVAFYEGLFLTPAPENGIRNLMGQVRDEMSIA